MYLHVIFTFKFFATEPYARNIESQGNSITVTGIVVGRVTVVVHITEVSRVVSRTQPPVGATIVNNPRLI